MIKASSKYPISETNYIIARSNLGWGAEIPEKKAEKIIPNQAQNNVKPWSAEAPKETIKEESGFSDTLNSLLGKNHVATDLISEEDLYAGLIGKQIKEQFGESMYNDYKLAFDLGMSEKSPGHSGPSSEHSARQAIKYLVESNSLTKDQSRSIRVFARENAQLDENNKLFDAIDGPGDTTKAVEAFDKIQGLITERMAKVATK
jgi:hypothetical protein